MFRRIASTVLHTARSVFEDPLRGLRLALLMLMFVITGATLTYILLEKMTFTDALFMTVITISTVGFGEVQPLSPAGRLFTILLILLGVGSVTAIISSIVSIIMGPEMWLRMHRRRMETKLISIENHYIICGFGRMGHQIIGDLRARNELFVVIDQHIDDEEMLEADIKFIIGDTTEDEVLLAAGIERARGLVAALDTDADNVMTILSARELNPNLFIVARVSSSEAEAKLRRAGADRVISPYQIGGHRIALSLLRPSVSDFLDQIFRFSQNIDADIGQVFVGKGSALAGQTVESCELRQSHQINILAISKPDGEMVITPNPSTLLDGGCTLIVIGPPHYVYELEQKYGRTTEDDTPAEPKAKTG